MCEYKGVMAGEKKTDYRVQIDESLGSEMDKALQRRGTSRTEGVSRIFRWFLDLPPTVQADALGQLPEDTGAEVARILLERIEERLAYEYESASERDADDQIEVSEAAEMLRKIAEAPDDIASRRIVFDRGESTTPSVNRPFKKAAKHREKQQKSDD